jgi:hypothetical protein
LQQFAGDLSDAKISIEAPPGFPADFRVAGSTTTPRTAPRSRGGARIVFRKIEIRGITNY